MSESSAAREPSMEEILASIRRIISDEEAAMSGEPEEETTPPEPEPEDEELSQEDLDAMFSAAEPEPDPEPEPEPDEIDMAIAMAVAEEEPEPDPEEPEPEPEDNVLQLQTDWQEEPLVEPKEDDLVFIEEEPEPEKIEEVVSQVLEEKVAPLLGEALNTTPTPDGPLPKLDPGSPLVSDMTSQKVTSAFDNLTHTILSNNTRTMENVVEDMLRPMLKAWLDQNLPVMVERLVRAEIERVSRGEQYKS